MGKKNKTKDIWDLSPEEQAKQMDELYAIESGDVNVLSLGKTKVGTGINKNGFSNGLESEIVKDLCGVTSTPVILGDNQKEPSKHPIGKTNMEEVIGVSPVKNEPKSQPIAIDEPKVNVETPASKNCTHTEVKSNGLGLTTVRPISFNINKYLNRMVLDDGVAPTAFSFDIGLSQELAAMYDASEVSDMIPDLLLYIISLKHPTAIYEYDDFMNRDYWKFASVKGGRFDINKYIFFTANGYVFCYLVDYETIKNFNDYMDELKYDHNDDLRTYISLAYATGTMQQAFFVEEEGFIKLFMKSKLNKQKDFHKIFTNDMSIEFVPNGEDVTEDDGIEMYHIDDLQSYVREMIGRVTGTSYFGDDDGWDDGDDEYPSDEEETEYNQTENFDGYNEGRLTAEECPSEEISEEESVDELLSEEMEVVEEQKPDNNITKLPTNTDDDDFIVDVVRKK